MRGPTIVIAGAPKCGTTALFGDLSSHPDIEGSRHKEPYYFHVNKPRFTVSDLEWVMGTKAPFGSHQWYAQVSLAAHYTDASYGSLWRGDTVHRIEATPCYLCDREVPERLAEACPDVRVILLLRHPVRRALSHWQMHRRAGWEPESDPQIAFESEPYDVDEFFWGIRNYVRHSLYGRQLQRWRKYFPAGNIKVLIYESFYANHQVSIDGVTDWLGLGRMALSNAGWRAPRKICVDGEFEKRWMEFFAGDVALLEAQLGMSITEWQTEA